MHSCPCTFLVQASQCLSLVFRDDAAAIHICSPCHPSLVPDRSDTRSVEVLSRFPLPITRRFPLPQELRTRLLPVAHVPMGN